MNTEWLMNKYFKSRSAEFTKEWIAHCRACYEDVIDDGEKITSFEAFLHDSSELLQEEVEYHTNNMIEAVNLGVKQYIAEHNKTFTCTIQTSNQTVLVTLDFKFN